LIALRYTPVLPGDSSLCFALICIIINPRNDISTKIVVTSKNEVHHEHFLNKNGVDIVEDEKDPHFE
jgi:hypothetical protein